MKILVTGGAGFIGSHVADELIAQKHKVAVVDNLSTGKRENVPKKAKFYKIDITSRAALEKIFAKFRPEAIFHLAAQASVRNSVKNPVKDVKVNVIGTINLLELAVKNEAKKFIFSSTGGAIYGDDVLRPTPEEAATRPASPYGLDKFSAERYIEYFGKQSNLKMICLRYANVYGPRQDPHGEAGVVAIFSAQMLQNEPITIFGSGAQTRDFVCVRDVVSANLAALSSPVAGIFNIGTGEETSVNKLADLMLTISKSKSPVKHGPERAGEQMRSSLATRKASLELGWQPKVTLKEGLVQTINWFKKIK